MSPSRRAASFTARDRAPAGVQGMSCFLVSVSGEGVVSANGSCLGKALLSRPASFDQITGAGVTLSVPAGLRRKISVIGLVVPSGACATAPGELERLAQAQQLSAYPVGSLTTDLLAGMSVTIPDTYDPGTAANVAGACLAPAPAITGITPLQGGWRGNVAVKITGSGFNQGATVGIGGGACTVSAVTSTEIDCVTGKANGPGPLDVTVANPGSQQGVLRGGGPNGYTGTEFLFLETGLSVFPTQISVYPIDPVTGGIPQSPPKPSQSLGSSVVALAFHPFLPFVYGGGGTGTGPGLVGALIDGLTGMPGLPTVSLSFPMAVGGPVIDRKGSFLALSESLANQIFFYKIDASGSLTALTANLLVGLSNPKGLVFSADSTRLFVGNATPPQVNVCFPMSPSVSCSGTLPFSISTQPISIVTVPPPSSVTSPSLAGGFVYALTQGGVLVGATLDGSGTATAISPPLLKNPTDNPSALMVDPTRHFLFVIEQHGIESFSIGQNGALISASPQSATVVGLSSSIISPAVDVTGHFFFALDSMLGTLWAATIQSDGSLVSFANSISVPNPTDLAVDQVGNLYVLGHDTPGNSEIIPAQIVPGPPPALRPGTAIVGGPANPKGLIVY